MKPGEAPSFPRHVMGTSGATGRRQRRGNKKSQDPLKGLGEIATAVDSVASHYHFDSYGAFCTKWCKSTQTGGVMSNPIESTSEEVVTWRKRIPLKRNTLKLLEEEAKSTVRTAEGMAAYIIEDFFKRRGEEGR